MFAGHGLAAGLLTAEVGLIQESEKVTARRWKISESRNEESMIGKGFSCITSFTTPLLQYNCSFRITPMD